MSRIRTVRQAYLDIKEADPKSNVSERLIRDIINDNRIPVITQGTKKLINLDMLEAYLDNPDAFNAGKGGDDK